MLLYISAMIILQFEAYFFAYPRGTEAGRGEGWGRSPSSPRSSPLLSFPRTQLVLHARLAFASVRQEYKK